MICLFNRNITTWKQITAAHGCLMSLMPMRKWARKSCSNHQQNTYIQCVSIGLYIGWQVATTATATATAHCLSLFLCVPIAYSTKMLPFFASSTDYENILSRCVYALRVVILLLLLLLLSLCYYIQHAMYLCRSFQRIRATSEYYCL